MKVCWCSFSCLFLSQTASPHDPTRGHFRWSQQRRTNQMERVKAAFPTADQGSLMADSISFGEKCSSVFDNMRVLFPGDYICSNNGVHRFGLSAKGDLGIWSGSMQVWSAKTCCERSNIFAKIQNDGNLVVRNDFGTQWSSRTAGKASLTKVIIRNDGVVTVVNKASGKIMSINSSIGGNETWLYFPPSPQPISCVGLRSETILLNAGQFLCSPNKLFQFGIDLSGNFGLFEGSQVIWSVSSCYSDCNVFLQRDGNLVLKTTNNQILWSTRLSPSRVAGSSVLVTDSGSCRIVSPEGRQVWAVAMNPTKSLCDVQVNGSFILGEGGFICSENMRFRFGMFDGDLSLWDYNYLRWSAGTFSTMNRAQMQLKENGRLTVVNSSGHELWAANSSNSVGASLRLGNDGRPELRSSEGKVLWKLGQFRLYSAVTNQRPPSKPPDNRRVPTRTPTQKKPSLAKQRIPTLTPTRKQPARPVKRLEPKTPLPKSKPSENLSIPTLFPTSSPSDSISILPSTPTRTTLSRSESPSILLPSPRQIPTTSSIESISILPSDTTQPSNSPLKSWSGQLQTPYSSSRNPSLSSFFPKPNSSILPSKSRVWSASQAPSHNLVTPSDSKFTGPHRLPTPAFRCVQSAPGEIQLRRGEFICSPNGKFRFGLTFDGTLALLDGDVIVWKNNDEGYCVKLHHDGELELVGNEGFSLWSTRTSDTRSGHVQLVLENDGVAAIRSSYLGYVWSTATEMKGRIIPDSLHNKVVTGYQGWFHAKGDSGWNRWIHWSRPDTIPSIDTVSVDLWPDVSELETDELFPTDLSFSNGSVASLYSATKAKSVERHCRWMQEYNIDGLFLQRFVGTAVKSPATLNNVLSNVRSGAEKYGRIFSIMYDIGNGNKDSLVEDLINDWKRLVDVENVTASGQYLRHRGYPLLAIWGLGFYDRFASPAQALALLDWFQLEAEDKYKVTLVGGVPAGWRELKRDSQPLSEWASIYRRFDVISPWTVGRMNERSTDAFFNKYILPDMSECERIGIDYLPVVFPGFSSFHQMGKPLNEIPRLGGHFLWRQMYNVLTAGSSMMYVAMFDEVDEGTAIFKVAATQEDAPVGTEFLTLDMDGHKLPNDWYLRVVGAAAYHVHTRMECPVDIPITP